MGEPDGKKQDQTGRGKPCPYGLLQLPHYWGLGGTILALLGAGCAKQAAPPAPSAPSVPAHWQLRLTTVPAAPRALDPVQFQVKISDSSGRPVSGATVTVSLVMPAMDMGQNQAAASASAAGIYTATSRFAMPGDWQVTVLANKQAERQSQSFPVGVQ